MQKSELIELTLMDFCYVKTKEWSRENEDKCVKMTTILRERCNFLPRLSNVIEDEDGCLRDLGNKKLGELEGLKFWKT